jgi:hypothetical protein
MRSFCLLVFCALAAPAAAFAQAAPDTTNKADSTAPRRAAAPVPNVSKGTTSRTPAARTAPAAARNDPTAARPARPVWPVATAEPLPGSILPHNRIVAYYGNPLSKRMGILGQVPPEQMLGRLDKEVAAWTRADSTKPVVPALHLIAVVAQGSAGTDGMYRARMPDDLVEKVHTWARTRNGLLFLDLQVARSTLQAELPRLEKFLSRPDVHLGIDPEFAMKRGGLPGKRIGTYDASDVNWAIDFLAGIVDRYGLPPKVLVIHRFTRPMLTNAREIRLDPRVQVVIHMDGWGPPWMKIDSYQAYVYSEPVQFTGFKLFYHNDTKSGTPLMKPADVLALFPRPLYIQYQ